MYVDSNRIEHESYEAACRYYGVDTPAQIAAEYAECMAEAHEHMMDRLEAGEVQPGAYFSPYADDIPF